MDVKWVHSPKNGIPICGLFTGMNGEPRLMIKNANTGKTEEFSSNSLLFLIATAVDLYRKGHPEEIK